jgi:hypothetical protein
MLDMAINQRRRERHTQRSAFAKHAQDENDFQYIEEKQTYKREQQLQHIKTDIAVVAR